MRVIPTFVHGVIDYLGAVAFLFAPEIFGFADGPSAAVLVPRVLGVLSVLYSVATAYELGLVKVLSMRTHLRTDYVVALTFVASPFVFGFIHGSTRQWLPHIGAAIFVLIVTTLTQTEPTRRGS
ncbi:MAG TPA: hypothetical protein VK993_08110 [Chthoniobacterales bacterium]|nr:hypothetical protein [Chthoniobacterales bacterium]